ncbi:pentapeptide repeat-containing protein [Streptomyces sp. NPDC001668]|uniref:pentapeptide repeat-containing protein n=1 Tax=unclassified Streptomyces TaxID=2593676 RepID=UPI0036B77A97
MTSLPAAPPWPHCAQGVGLDDPVGCRGHRIEPFGRCLRHLTDRERATHFSRLGPGSAVDHRGTELDALLLTQLLDALRDPVTRAVRLGHADFRSATFEGTADFRSAIFERNADFRLATFKGTANFVSVTFMGNAWFGSATFVGVTWFELTTFASVAGFAAVTFRHDVAFVSPTFEGAAWFESAIFEGYTDFRTATFKDQARFRSAVFKGDVRFTSVLFKDTAFKSAVFERNAWFRSATFEGDARFGLAIFEGDADFRSAVFKGNARFTSAVFERSAGLGPLVCLGQVTLSGAMFNCPVTIAIAARRLECWRTHWSSTATLQLRYATVDFAHSVFEHPLTIIAEQGRFRLSDGTSVDEQALSRATEATVWVASLRGVDAAHLVLADVNLSRCLFTGTVHLDQLRLEGTCSFDVVPSHTHWWNGHPVWFTQRRTLAEEHHWRAGRPEAIRGWNTAVLGTGPVGPAQLAPVYRALRKSFEDCKNEPGAADFYYGEMEMRRHDSSTSRAERHLLTTYWALSGYGLRATRALGWLLLAITSTLLAMMLWGLAVNDPKSVSTGKVTGQDIQLTTDTPDPANPIGPLQERISGERFEKGLRVVINAVVFHSSDQHVTTAGTYIETLSRLTEPVLLGMAALAVRNRVKR